MVGLIAAFRVRSPRLVLRGSLVDVPEVGLELTREVGTDATRLYLFFRARGADVESFERAMVADEIVTDLERYAAVDGQVLYRLQISDATEVVSYPVRVELGADQLEAQWSDGWWRNRVRFPDREALRAVHRWCDANAVEFELEAVYDDDETAGGCAGRLTPKQRGTLETACAMGYFAVPREASTADVADELGVSSRTVSERLRRGHVRPVRYHLGIRDLNEWSRQVLSAPPSRAD